MLVSSCQLPGCKVIIIAVDLLEAVLPYICEQILEATSTFESPSFRIVFLAKLCTYFLILNCPRKARYWSQTVEVVHSCLACLSTTLRKPCMYAGHVLLRALDSLQQMFLVRSAKQWDRAVLLVLKPVRFAWVNYPHVHLCTYVCL